jgi:hypothetical protein
MPMYIRKPLFLYHANLLVRSYPITNMYILATGRCTPYSRHNDLHAMKTKQTSFDNNI